VKSENPARRGGAPNGSAKNQGQITSRFAEWPRPVREIRDELCDLAASPPVSAVRLDELANELAWAAAIAAMYGGDTAATEKLERAVRESAELARITAAHRRAVAA
jgi:hypothetical protein